MDLNGPLKWKEKMMKNKKRKKKKKKKTKKRWNSQWGHERWWPAAKQENGLKEEEEIHYIFQT